MGQTKSTQPKASGSFSSSLSNQRVSTRCNTTSYQSPSASSSSPTVGLTYRLRDTTSVTSTTNTQSVVEKPMDATLKLNSERKLPSPIGEGIPLNVKLPITEENISSKVEAQSSSTATPSDGPTLSMTKDNTNGDPPSTSVAIETKDNATVTNNVTTPVKSDSSAESDPNSSAETDTATKKGPKTKTKKAQPKKNKDMAKEKASKRNFLFPIDLTPANSRLLKKLDKIPENVEPFKRSQFAEGSIMTYDQLFGPYLNEDLKAIKIQEPFLNNNSQLFNLVRFLEVCVVNAPNLKVVMLLTKIMDNPEEQKTALMEIAMSLKARDIFLIVEFVSRHDRTISFDNGYLFDLGQGLHYFKTGPIKSRFSLGINEQRLRPCKEFICTICRFGAPSPSPDN